MLSRGTHSRRFHFVHTTDAKGRGPMTHQSRKQLKRHVMMDHIARSHQTALKNHQPTEAKRDIDEYLVRLLSDQALASPNLPSPHAFNSGLQKLGVSDFRCVDDVWKWQSIGDVFPDQHGSWVTEARETWGIVLWEAALTDPLIFYTYLQVVLDKIAVIKSVDHNSKFLVLAAKALPLLNERIQHPAKLTGDEAWCVSAFVYLALRTGDYATAESHMNGMQMLLDLHEPDARVWPYTHLVDVRLAGLLCRRPYLRKHFSPSKWPPQASLAESQRHMVSVRAKWYAEACVCPEDRLRGLLLSCFTQLLSCERVQQLRRYNVVSQTQGLYGLMYDACLLHGMAAELTTDVKKTDIAFFDLCVVSIKLCAWALSRHLIPQAGEVPRAVLQHVDKRLAALPQENAGFITAAIDSGIDMSLMLWVLFISYAESLLHGHSTERALLQRLKAVATHIGLKGTSQMSSTLQRMPCVAMLYPKRLALACRQVMEKTPSRWQPLDQIYLTQPRGPLTGFVMAFHFDIGEGEI